MGQNQPRSSPHDALKRPLVLALNPSVDAEWRVDAVCWEEKNNILSERRWAGGKGVNVARWLKHLGGNPHLVLPLAGDSGRELASLLRAEKLSATVIRLGVSPSAHPTTRGKGDSGTRVNIIVSTKTQGQLRFNPPGPEISRSEWQMILRRIRAALGSAGCLILSGSLPRGVPVNAYARLIRSARARRIPVLLDCDGPALAAAVSAKPFFVKPNEHELLSWARSAGLPFGLAESCIHRAAAALSRVTCGWVLVSRGAKPSLLVNVARGFEVMVTPPKGRPRNTVGAGDALLAAVAHALLCGLSPELWLALGVKTGSAATQLEAGELPVVAPSPPQIARATPRRL